MIEFSLIMKKIEIWQKPVPMLEVIQKLDFIKNKTSWGNYMQGGVLRLSDKKYEIIVPNYK